MSLGMREDLPLGNAWLRFAVSHSFRRKREKDRAPVDRHPFPLNLKPAADFLS
jgi:hypothetical protein